MNDPDILTDIDFDERAEPPPVTYAQEAERITRVGINRRVDNLNDLEFELQEDAARFSDFTPVCKHHFDYFPARHIWIVFKCAHCGKTYEPDDVCRMLNAGILGVGE